MVIKLRAELLDDSTGDVRPVLGYQREEIVYLPITNADLSDPEKFDQALAIVTEEAGTTLLDWLDQAKDVIGKQAARLAQIHDRPDG